MRKLIRSNIDAYSKIVDRTGLSTLAVAVSSYAPMDIITTLIEANPVSASLVDQYGASPLHIACLNGTNLETFRLITEHDKEGTAGVPDNNNYTVLHHAVEHVCILIEGRYFGEDQCMGGSEHTIESEHQDYLEIIKDLCERYPRTVHIATFDNGDTPLDIPQIMMMKRPCKKNNHYHKRLEEVYRILKEASIRIYRAQKHHWENSTEKGYKTSSDTGRELPI